MSKISTLRQKRIEQRNKKVLDGFIGSLAYMASSMSKNVMQQVAQEGLEKMVAQAYFNDYTGVLMNSYQAAVMNKGKFAYGTQGDFNGGVLNGNEIVQVLKRSGMDIRVEEEGVATFYGPNGEAQLYTSYMHSEASKISFRSEHNKQKKINIRKIRTSKYAKTIPYRFRDIRRTKSSYPDGYGRDISKIRSVPTSVRNGVYVAFGNPTPYAAHVHNARGKGGEFHRVFPTQSPITGTWIKTMGEKNMKKMMSYIIGKYGIKVKH